MTKQKPLIIGGAVGVSLQLVQAITFSHFHPVKPVERPHGIVSGPCSGWSMLGAFPQLKNQTEFIQTLDCRVTIKDINVGDVVVFRNRFSDRFGGQPRIIHKVIEKKDGQVRTQGTGNVDADPQWITDLDLVGKVLSVSDAK